MKKKNIEPLKSETQKNVKSNSTHQISSSLRSETQKNGDPIPPTKHLLHLSFPHLIKSDFSHHLTANFSPTLCHLSPLIPPLPSKTLPKPPPLELFPCLFSLPLARHHLLLSQHHQFLKPLLLGSFWNPLKTHLPSLLQSQFPPLPGPQLQ
ncbi:hypothetical protein AAC387_Pa08g0594 [Persea americana]